VGDIYHSVLCRDAWYSRHSRIATIIGENLKPENMIGKMHQSMENCNVFENGIWRKRRK